MRTRMSRLSKTRRSARPLTVQASAPIVAPEGLRVLAGRAIQARSADDILTMQRLLGNGVVQRFVAARSGAVIHRCGSVPCDCPVGQREPADDRELSSVGRFVQPGAKAATATARDGTRISRQDGGAGSADASQAEGFAEEVYDALDGWNDEERALRALGGHSESMRQAIRWAFSDEYDQSIAGYVDDQLDGDDRVNAFSLLSHSNSSGLETAMALCLIPLGTRDDELWRIFNSLTIDGRKRLEEEYNRTFGTAGEGSRYSHHIGEGSLREDLEEDLSGTDEDKALAMLDHELTSAEKLYLDSRGQVGTEEGPVIRRLQSEWDKGFANFASFESDWDRYVKNGDWDNSGETLYEAMDEELSGEDWKVVKAILDGARAAQEGGFYSTPANAYSEEELRQIEDIELDVHRATLRAAASGAGTGEEQLFRAVEKIQEIWTRRIARARPNPPEREGNPQLLAIYESGWAADKEWAGGIIRDEMDEGWGDRERALLLLEGNLTAADELYVAKLELDDDKMLAAVDKAWGQGKLGELRQLARQERRGADGNVVRPVFSPLYDTIPITSGVPWRRLNALIDGGDDVSAGVARLKIELDEGDDDSDLQRAYAFLTNSQVRDGLMGEVVSGYASRYLGNEQAETGTEKFLNYIARRYERSNAYWNFLDKLNPTTDMRERLERAQGRWEANIGIGDVIASALTNPFTQEDTLAVAGESLVRLSQIVQAENATSPELEAMLAITGKHSLEELAGFEYDQFVDRLEDVRALKRAVAEALALLAEIAVDLAVTVATGGAAGGPLLASLASTVAGMMVREAMLGRYYDVQSMQNLQALTVAVASAGFGSLGTAAFKNIPAEKLAELSHAELFLREAGAEAVQSVGSSITSAAFDNKMPSAEDVAAKVISIGGRGLGAAGKARLARRINDQMSGVERLRAQVMSNMAQQVVSGVSDETAELVRTGTGELSATDIALRYGRSVTGGMLRGVGAGVGEHGAERVAAARTARQLGADADAGEEEGAPVPRPDDESTAAATTTDEQARVAEEMARIGAVSEETQQMLEGNSNLRRAFADHPEATRILKLCASPCLPEHATPSQLAQLEQMLDVMEAAGFPVRDEGYQSQLRRWFHREENFNNLSRALNELDATFQVHRYRSEIDAMAQQGQGVSAAPPDPTALSAAVARFVQGAPTEDDARTLLAQAVADYRAFRMATMDTQFATNERRIAALRESDPVTAAIVEQGQSELAPHERPRRAQLDADSLKGQCGAGRDLSLDSLQSLVADTPDTITMHRYQAADLGFGAQHGFAIVVFPAAEGKPAMRFIVDPTMAQFMHPDRPGYTGGAVSEQQGGATVAGLKVVRDVLRDGFAPLTEETARQYVIALGANEDQAGAAAASIMSGQAAVNTDLVTSGGVVRSTGAAAADIPNLDIDLVQAPQSGPQWHVVEELNEVLSSGDPPVGSPLWTEMAGLRDHLMEVGDRLASVPGRRGPVTSTRR